MHSPNGTSHVLDFNLVSYYIKWVKVQTLNIQGDINVALLLTVSSLRDF